MGQHYKEIAEIALKRREAAIPKEYLLPEKSLAKLPQNLTTVPRESGHFTTKELEITESNAEDILLKIKSKTWTSVEVTKAFSKAAIVAQQLVCLAFSGSEHMLTQELDKLSHRNPHPRSSGSSPIPR